MQKPTKQLHFDDSNISTVKVCNFLVNVFGNMYTQWSKKKPDQADFNWGTDGTIAPLNVCTITNAEYDITDFNFGPLIWSSFKLGKHHHNEPFGSIVTHKNGDLYLTFRGSKSLKDFIIDAAYAPVNYTPPTSNAVKDIKVESGWHAVYKGLEDALRAQLKPLTAIAGTKITITGHSLGSTIATLAVPEAVANGMEVYHYNSASPMVGLQSFTDYYNSLTIDAGAGILKETFRLVNEADIVPGVPNNLAPKLQLKYVPVGKQLSFTADYCNEGKTHDPCASYAYAIWNPDNPYNTANSDCGK